jgi:16S rRNA (guanine966-N2)-methyltransferase
MRIIAGEFRGRSLKPPTDRRVRPTADRVREAWFSILAPDLPGARVLDLFAGSGALGLEALSRGAQHVDFVEISRSSLEALRANVAALDAEERVRVHRGDALRFISRLSPRSYDVALADPPYSTDQAQRLVQCFRERPFSGILGVEHRATVDLAGDDTRRYGDVALTFCFAP